MSLEATLDNTVVYIQGRPLFLIDYFIIILEATLSQN